MIEEVYFADYAAWTYQCGLAMIDVSNDRNVADIRFLSEHIAVQGLCKLT